MTRSQKNMTGSSAQEPREPREIFELNERVRTAAKYLYRLDRYAESVRVDPDTGEIDYEKPTLEKLADEGVKKYQRKFTELIKRFKERNKAFIKILQSNPSILDVKDVAGGIIATYDSARGTPTIDGVHFDSNVEHARGRFARASDRYLGLIVVDINKEKRKDGVSVNVSAIHELHHYMLSISDYLMSQDEGLGMQSAYRTIRSVALYGSGKERISTIQAFVNDKELYSKMLGREFDTHTELPRIEAQLSYLDELHSSFLQRKENWFSAQRNVYSTKGKGKHWELVGDHSDDIEASKRLLGYLQGFYTLDKIRETWQRLLSDGRQFGEGQKKFLIECAQEFRNVGGLIGTARTIKQAEMLIAESWKEFMARYPRIATTTEFTQMIGQWEMGSGVENLREILLLS